MMGFNYVKLYSWLFFRYGLNEFSVEALSSEVERPLSKTPLTILLQRLCSKGLVERVSKGRYRAVHPYTLLLEALGYRWREKVAGDYRLVVEYAVSSVIERFKERLVSIVLFGSLARGSASKYSDVDLLVVAEGVPSSYGERVRAISDILEGVGEVRRRLWAEKGLYPLIDLILLDKEEAKLSHPFYLDMVEDAIIIYDRASFMRRKIEEVRRRLGELGSRRVELPDGRYYWVLKPSIEWGEVIEL